MVKAMKSAASRSKKRGAVNKSVVGSKTRRSKATKKTVAPPKKDSVSRSARGLHKFAVTRRRSNLKAAAKNIWLYSPSEPIGQAWPEQDLVWYGMPEPCGMGPLLPDVMRSRGWKEGGSPCHVVKSKCCPRTWTEGWTWTVFMKEFAAALEGKSPKDVFGCDVEEDYRLQSVCLPRRALWLLGSSAFRVPNSVARFREDFSVAMAKHGKGLPSDGSYRMLSYPGMENALNKKNLSIAFRGKSWFPRSYVIPDEKRMLMDDIRSTKSSRQNYWICKPPNDYGGEGITVFHGTDKALAEVIRESEDEGRQVVQSYLADPLLIGGYKFHVRIHMAITSLDPPKAYVQLNGQCLFATEPYKISAQNTGKNFKAPVHVTNMCLNATEENKDNYFREKPVIGIGQQFRVDYLEEWLTENYPGYDSTQFWQQVVAIAAETTRYIAKANSVKKFGKFPTNHFFEIFGLDLMLDKALNMYMCEVNTNPGLDYPDELILGEPNPDYDKETALSGDTWHDLMALLGLDAGLPQERGSLKSWFEVDFENYHG